MKNTIVKTANHWYCVEDFLGEASVIRSFVKAALIINVTDALDQFAGTVVKPMNVRNVGRFVVETATKKTPSAMPIANGLVLLNIRATVVCAIQGKNADVRGVRMNDRRGRMKDGGNPKRRRISPSSGVSLRDLPNEALSFAASFLARPSRAMFAIAVGGDDELGLSVILGEQFGVLDFGEVEKTLAAKITDDDLQKSWCLSMPTPISKD